MILDAGIATVLRRENISGTGDMPKKQEKEVYRSFYGERTVGISRFYSARQTNDRVDLLIRMILPADPRVKIHADDVCVLSKDGMRYRIVQVQYLRDDDAGQDVCDLSLELITGGAKDDCSCD